MFTFAFTRRATPVVLATAIIAGAAACQARDGTIGAGVPPTTHAAAAHAAAVSATGDPEVRALIADAREARTQHDARALHRIRVRLVGLLGEATTRQAETTYRRVLADLAAADAAHDAMARARFRAQLRALCDPAGVTSALVSCEAGLASHGG
jgi:hypothetical protein